MDKLNEDLLKRVEGALNLTLKDWQKNYILDMPMVLDMSITGRNTGKTLAYVIKLLFSDDTPIKAYNMVNIAFVSDNYHDMHLGMYNDNPYNRWFRGYLLDIYRCLTSVGIRPRKIFLSKLDQDNYERELNI